MDWHDLLQREYWLRAVKCGGWALLLFLFVWWRERREGSSWPLAATGAAWMGCHLAVSFFSFLIPPKQPVDWLMTGSEVVIVVALFSVWKRWPALAVRSIAAVVIMTASWLALRQMPFLLERTETPEQRQLYTVAGIGGLLCTFLAAEWVACKMNPAGFLAGLAVFSLLMALSLWRMISPVNTISRPVVAGALCAGAALAALLRWRHARISPGMAGWLAAGIIVLFTFGCLSRVTDVPLLPVSAAAGVIPATALLVTGYRAVFSSGQSFALIAALLLGGTGVFMISGRPDEKPAEKAPAETGADDTGAYD